MASDDPELDELTRSYYEAGKTDGLPIVPPTPERVEAMFEATTLEPDATLGTVGTRKGAVTVETVAVNGVMAGCLPLHMPVLLAGARALIDPKSNAIQASVSTGSWGYCFLVNGPIRETLDINSGTGAFGPGYRSNQTLGRALGLLYKNCAQIHLGEKEMSTLGNPFKFSLFAGENEAQSPWKPYASTRGIDAGQNAITFAAPNSFIQPIPGNISAQGVVSNLIANTPPHIQGLKTETANERYEGFQTEVFYAISPYNADELSSFSRAELREYIYENAIRPASEFDSAIDQSSGDESLSQLHHRQFDDPDRINIVVVGGSGRFNAVIGPTLGGPTTKPIELPDNWDTLCERHGGELSRDWGPHHSGDQ